jgi:hypothetical protein
MEPIQGTRVGRSGSQRWMQERPERRSPPGRVCANRGCDTVLSIYNRQRYCSVHAKDGYDPRTSHHNV